MTRPSQDGEAWAAAVSAAADLLVVSSAEGLLLQVSEASDRVLGWTPEELEGRPLGELVDPTDTALVAAHLEQVLHGRDPHPTASFGLRGPDGALRRLEAHSRRLEAPEPVVVSVLREVTARTRALAELQWRASTDPLTGVANRSTLLDRLAQALRRLDRAPGALAVLAVDVDGFKPVNDALGHAAGDQVLVEMAARLGAHLRPTDTLARTGGDEFVIVVEGAADDATVDGLVQRVLEAGRAPLWVEGRALVCTMSVGVSTTDDAGMTAEDLWRQADTALYRAKRLGRGRVERFQAGGAPLPEQARRVLHLELRPSAACVGTDAPSRT